MVDITTHLEDISINVKSFGAIGDGVSDDTEAFKTFASYIREKSGLSLTIPSGVYILSERVDLKFNDSVLNCYGTIQLSDGIITPYGIIHVGGVNNVVNGLSLDGNESNALDEQAFGVSALLVIDEGASNVEFNNLKLVNSKYSAIIYNGNTQNVRYYNTELRNIGEHCWYISGGDNRGGLIKGVRCTDFGVYKNRGQQPDSSHVAFMIKSNDDRQPLNYDIRVEDVEIDFTVDATGANAVMIVNSMQEINMVNIKVDDSIKRLALLNLNNFVPKPKIYIDKVKTARVESAATSGVPYDIEIHNSEFTNNEMTRLLFYKIVSNTTFNLMTGSFAMRNFTGTGEYVLFNNVTFVFTNVNNRFDIQHDGGKTIIFKDCRFESITEGQVYRIMRPSEGVTLVNTKFEFYNCEVKGNIRHVFEDNGLNPDLFLKVINCVSPNKFVNSTGENSTNYRRLMCIEAGAYIPNVIENVGT